MPNHSEWIGNYGRRHRRLDSFQSSKAAIVGQNYKEGLLVVKTGDMVLIEVDPRPSSYAGPSRRMRS